MTTAADWGDAGMAQAWPLVAPRRSMTFSAFAPESCSSGALYSCYNHKASSINVETLGTYPVGGRRRSVPLTVAQTKTRPRARSIRFMSAEIVGRLPDPSVGISTNKTVSNDRLAEESPGGRSLRASGPERGGEKVLSPPDPRNRARSGRPMETPMKSISRNSIQTQGRRFDPCIIHQAVLPNRFGFLS
jgi:hypothetical protein